MVNSGNVNGSIESHGEITGEVKTSSSIYGTVAIGGGGGSKNAVLYVEQNLTD